MKRIFDICIAALLAIALLPLMVILYFWIHLRLGRPVFFRQQRPGLNGKPFTLVKFRTMRDLRGADGQLVDDAERMTRLGGFLRATSLDELPELWNVLRGDMSLVGPRPLLMQYLSRYSPHQARRHEVRPGLTGWAQINGRNALDWDERLDMDVWYVDNRSFILDLKILALTLLKVLKREGITAANAATMHEFTGPRRDTCATDRADTDNG